MLECRGVFNTLLAEGVEFFAGVPDSLLKPFCAYVSDHAGPSAHQITANEGSAIALVTGYHLATGGLGLVYMQNSGQGNAVNPLVSLADPQVYGIPLLVMIGWRGRPGTHDEPQHLKQGAITLPLLEVLSIPHQVLSTDPAEAEGQIQDAARAARRSSAPHALVVKKGSFEAHAMRPPDAPPYPMSREDAVRLIADRLGPGDAVISTTGKASRELFEHRAANGGAAGRDFLTVGSMGHASQIALGVAIGGPDRQVFCLDGDGAVIMHMGSMATIGSRGAENLKHVVLNNGAHDSVGGQPTAGFDIDLPAIARACGYRLALRATSSAELGAGIDELRRARGPALLEVRVKRGARSDLGRPTTTPRHNKQAFMDWLEGRSRRGE